MVKIRIIISENINIFTVYKTLFENVITILPISHQNKSKMPGKYRKCLVFIEIGKLSKLYTTYLSIIFRWSCLKIRDKINLNIQMGIFMKQIVTQLL